MNLFEQQILLKRKNQPLTPAYVHLLVELHLVVFVPAFSVSHGES